VAALSAVVTRAQAEAILRYFNLNNAAADAQSTLPGI